MTRLDFPPSEPVEMPPDQALIEGMRELGELVNAGGGDALLKRLDDARSGRRLDI